MRKYFLFVLFLSGAISSHAQNYDSLKREIEQLRIDYYAIDFTLQKAHEQYSSGTLLLGLGLGASVIGTVLYSLKSEDPGPVAPGLMIAGGATSLIGGIIQIDSHKWFARRKR